MPPPRIGCAGKSRRSNRGESDARLHAEEPLLDRGLAPELLRRALELDAPLVHDVEPVGQPHRDLERLLDEQDRRPAPADLLEDPRDRKSTRLNSSHSQISYAVFCLNKNIEGLMTTENDWMLLSKLPLPARLPYCSAMR